MITYNPWPIGQVPEHLQRPELKNFEFTDAREIVKAFEDKIAAFAGAPYCVVVDCCTHAIELSCRYEIEKAKLSAWNAVTIPENTYISVYQTLKRIFYSVKTEFQAWQGVYKIGGTRIVDGAVRWRSNMYEGGLHCLSFQLKKPIPIGRGGAILCSTREEYEWLKLASYDGRDLNTPYDSKDHVKMQGYHYYMTPEDAARGIMLMDAITFEGDSATWENYPKI